EKLEKKEDVKKKEPPKTVAKKEQEENKKRPPKLDKTPDKTKAIRKKDAKVVQKADDFLAALDFVDNIKKQAERPAVEQEDSVLEETDELSIGDQAELAKIKKKIEQNWLVPPGLKGMDDLSVVVEVRVGADGTVQDVDVTQSSGQGFFDQSLLRAVRKASPLPIPADNYKMFKIIELSFKG
ncbi:MAG: TonB family protein, partial [Alphaproteobacteria bacterium]